MTTPEHPAPDLRQSAVQAREALDEALTYIESPTWSPSMARDARSALASLDAALSAPPAQEQAGQMAAGVREFLEEVASRRNVRLYADDLADKASTLLSASASGVQQEGAAPNGEPIDMVLFCPKCGVQHIDAPEFRDGWFNPPHRSHLCHGCGHIWRPADVPTNGVEAVKTTGKADSPAATPARADAPIGRLHQSRVDALIAVLEGECDGLAVTRETAEAILHYVDGNAPPIAGQPATSSEAAAAPVVPAELNTPQMVAVGSVLLPAVDGDEYPDPEVFPSIKALEQLQQRLVPYSNSPERELVLYAALAAPSADRAAAPAPVATLTDEELADCGLLSELDDGEAAPVGQPAAQAVEVRKKNGNGS